MQSTLVGIRAVIHNRLEQFQGYLDAKGRRLTLERRLVAEVAFALPGPFGVEDLLRELQRRQGARRVSRATVFRTLAALEDAGLVRLRESR